MSKLTKSPRRQALMQDVARRAGVSAMTVSRALREPQKVSASTRSRVERAIAQTGYVPNALAGGLRARSRSRVVAAIVPSLRNSLFTNTLQGLADALRTEGYSLMVGDSRYSQEAQTKLIRAFMAQRPSALVLHDGVSFEVASLVRRAGIPVVEVGDLVSRPLDIVVSYSNFRAGKALTEHLIERGYRRIAFVSLPAGRSRRAKERLRGYRSALNDSGLAEDPQMLLEIEMGFTAGGDALARLVALKPAPDAVFFAGDVHAVGALLEASRRRWRVPQRMAIASFDDHEIAASLSPALTALKIPRYEIGVRSGELIVARLAGEAAGPARVDLGFELIVRGST